MLGKEAVELDRRLGEKWMNWRAVWRRSGWTGEPSRGEAIELESRLGEKSLKRTAV
jgi:hypothetical protein